MKRREADTDGSTTGEFTAEGFSRRDLSVSMGAANLYVFVTTGPIVIVLAAAYAAVWGYEGLADAFSGVGRLLLLAVLVVGVVVHEAIHGLSWAFFGRKHLTALKFGFQLKMLTPYAHLKEPISARAYRLGAAAPGILMGLLPALIGIVTGNEQVVVFGLFFTFVAGGDALILWLIRKVDPDTFVEDHPTRAGCYALKPVEDRE